MSLGQLEHKNGDSYNGEFSGNQKHVLLPSNNVTVCIDEFVGQRIIEVRER